MRRGWVGACGGGGLAGAAVMHAAVSMNHALPRENTRGKSVVVPRWEAREAPRHEAPRDADLPADLRLPRLTFLRTTFQSPVFIRKVSKTSSFSPEALYCSKSSHPATLTP
ncbi:hypothetical protein E2C01_055411 [Portunus trituberculatus]|uniref:Uncharacterized protein n=1 Tax=Portunus trituberculatus TaxID=210409 RepID=A0A5B7GR40_PORTR|nr:hypothetical protein [Portunus trituberculatus]